MRAIVVVLLCLVVACAAVDTEDAEVVKMRAEVLAEATASHKARAATHQTSLMSDDLADRTNLLFRSLDVDHDKLISKDDVNLAQHHLRSHMPSITPAEFVSFIDAVDQDSDGKLSHQELLQGLTQGLQGTEFLETGEEAMAQTHEKRFIGAIGTFIKKVGNNLMDKLGEGIRKFKGEIDKSQDGCVMCQYIVERCEVNVKQSGVLNAVQAAAPAAAFLETESTAEQNPFDMAASKIIGATRMSTRYQRQLERQKYNEIYRITDITLDDVCEQGMPNSFYGYCKAIYTMQSDVVDGLRYQYRPTDVCFRIGMCGKKSYITEGVHSRYRIMEEMEAKASKARQSEEKEKQSGDGEKKE